MATRVRLSSPGIAALLKSAEVRAMLTPRAEAILAAAKASAPVSSGAYRDGLRIEQATTDRAVVRVVSSDFKGHILEARYGILSRALDGASGLVNYTRKDGKTIKVTAAQAANYSGRR